MDISTAHTATDAEWGHLRSHNEWVLSYDAATPVISERRALQLLVEHHGAAWVTRLAHLEAARLAEARASEPESMNGRTRRPAD